MRRPPRLAAVLALLAAGAPTAAASAATGPPAPPFVHGAAAATVIVKARAGASSRRLAVSERRAGALRTVGRIARLGLSVVGVSGDPVQAAARLSHAPGVRWAEPNYRVHATATPTDPLYPRTPLGWLGAPQAWDALGLSSFPGTGGVRVGVVDTGIDGTHEELRGKVAACASSTDGVIREGDCADGQGHGTHVAGTLAARAGNGVGVAGVAFSSPLIVCRALGADGSGTTADVAACLRWTHDRGAKVVSMSLGGPSSRTLADAAAYAWEGGRRGGSVLVAAAGNDGSAQIDYPAGLPEVVSVAATGLGDAIASFSNHNADVEIAAPGVDVLSARAGGGYVALSGTSMATPHVSGAAALLWDAHRSAAAETIRARLDAAVRDLGAPGRDPVYGFGRLDLTRVGR